MWSKKKKKWPQIGISRILKKKKILFAIWMDFVCFCIYYINSLGQNTFSSRGYFIVIINRIIPCYF